MPDTITVKIPATTANLGPGFDSLALALDLWNVTTFTLGSKGILVNIVGEGSDSLATDERNLTLQAFLHLYHSLHVSPPSGLLVRCENRIPLGSGLGSSASAVLAGLLGANALLGDPLCTEEILFMGSGLEGHPDNISAAVIGGLVIIATGEKSLLTRRIDIPPIQVIVVVPTFDFPTLEARAALPKMIPFADAVFNIGRTALVVEALRNGDLALLSQAMEDRLHQPYRLKLIPGSEDALLAATRAGAAAVGLSGAGPGLIAFCRDGFSMHIASAIEGALANAGLKARSYLLTSTSYGAGVTLI